MPETLPLFPEPEPELKSILAPRLRLLAAKGLFFGSSSWKYPGWLGQIYSPHRYSTQRRFEAECLGEYAETFPIVCGDFAFYQFPSPEFWRKLFAGISRTFQFAFKAPEEITRPRFPLHPRYGNRAGLFNHTFLDAALFKSQFLDLLAPYAERVPLIIFEFGAIPETIFSRAEEFAAALNPFLDKLPRTFRYAIEIRNPEFLEVAYLKALHNHGVAHVFNSWTNMPPVDEQLAIGDAFTANFIVSRALLKPGRKYQDAVDTFSPYSAVQESNQDVRDALRQLLARAESRAENAYFFINNRLEGFAPGTILAITDDF